MDWNTDGPNAVEIPEGAAAHDLGIFPRIAMIKRDRQACHDCPDCGRNVEQMGIKGRLYTGTAVKLRSKDGPMTGVQEVSGALLELPDELLLTHVEVWYRQRDEFVLLSGTKRANQRHEDPNDEYRRSKWVGPIAVFEIPGGQARAEEFLAAHNATLVEDHARHSGHPSHADVKLEG
jgi:hypothetical protein